MSFLTSKLLSWKKDSDLSQLSQSHQKQPQTLESIAVEAAKQRVENESSVDTARDAVFLQHFQNLATDEESFVRNYKQWKMNGGKGPFPPVMQEPQRGSIIICDDYTQDNSRDVPIVTPEKSQVLPWVLSAALAAGGAGALGAYLLNKPKTETPTVTQPVDTDFGSTTQLIQGGK